MPKNNDYRKPGYLALMKILLDEEIPFSCSDARDSITIEDDAITVEDLIQTFRSRIGKDVLETNSHYGFWLKEADEASITVHASYNKKFKAPYITVHYLEEGDE